MCVLKELEFKTVQGVFEANQWSNLYLGKGEECMSYLELGAFKIYMDVEGDGVLNKSGRRWTHDAIKMSAELLDKIEECNEISSTALNNRYRYVWEEEPRIKAMFYMDDSQGFRDEDLIFNPRYIHSALWLKLESIKLLRTSMEKNKEHFENTMTEEEHAQLKELHNIHGFSYQVDRKYRHENMEENIQKVLDENTELVNHLQHIECSESNGFLTLIWQSDNGAVNNKLSILLTQWG